MRCSLTQRVMLASAVLVALVAGAFVVLLLALDMGGAAVEQLEGVLGCTIQEAFVTYSGREGLGTQWAPGPEIASQGRGQQDQQDTV